jgi:hypothetical protein
LACETRLELLDLQEGNYMATIPGQKNIDVVDRCDGNVDGIAYCLLWKRARTHDVLCFGDQLIQGLPVQIT